LKNDVLAELRWEPRASATDVGVIVKNGVVTFTGNVDSYAEKWAVEKATDRVSGILAVADEIDVRLPGSSDQKKIESAFQRNAYLDSKKVTVSTYGDKVTLKDRVCSSAEREQLDVSETKRRTFAIERDGGSHLGLERKLTGPGHNLHLYPQRAQPDAGSARTGKAELAEWLKRPC
jgi:hypothetical protein